MSEGQGQQSIANTPAVSWPILEMSSHYLLTERYLFPTAVTQPKWFSILTRKVWGLTESDTTEAT